MAARWLGLVWLILGLGIAGAGADDALPVNVRADLLAKEIVAAAKAGNDKKLLDAITRYRALESQGHRTPPTILFHEAKAAKRTGDIGRAYTANQDYLKVADRSERNYGEALQLHSDISKINSREKAAKVSGAVQNMLRKLQEQMVDIPGGTFQMGDTTGDGKENEKPVHSVTIRPFRMSKYTVTSSEIRLFFKANRLKEPTQLFEGSDPRQEEYRGLMLDRVGNLDKETVLAFVDWLNKKSQARYRLPTEAEWEYACRAGHPEHKYCGGNNLEELGIKESCQGFLHRFCKQEATEKFATAPNAFGLYNMGFDSVPVGAVHHGGAEFVQDCYHKSYEGAPADGTAWTKDCGPSWRDDHDAFVRGRSVREDGTDGDPAGMRASARSETNFSSFSTGIRLAQDK